MNVHTSKPQKIEEKGWSLFGKSYYMLFISGILLTMLGNVGGCPGPGPYPPMLKSGVYCGVNDKYLFCWDVHSNSLLDGKVNIDAARLDVRNTTEFHAYGVLYWRGPGKKYTMDLNRSDVGLVALSENIGINPNDWWGFGHGSDWIEAFGVKLKSD